MGVDDLLAELKKRHPEAVRSDVLLSTFSGCRVAFDVSIYAYAYMYAARGEVLKHQENLNHDPDPIITRSCFLENYFSLAMAFIECNITLVPVFDGPAFRLKQDTKDDRAESAKERESQVAELRFKLAEDPNNDLIKEDLKKKIQSQIMISRDDWNGLEDLMLSMGLPVVKGKYEAEAVCARLYRTGLVAAVVSNDGDCLAHGGGIMIRNVKRSGRKTKTPKHICCVIMLDDVLRELRMSHRKFVDFCMLLGCDYISRMKGCGWVTALKFLRSEGSLEAVAGLWKAKNKVTSDHRILQPELVQEIRGYFLDNHEDCLPEFPLVVNYESGLAHCFDRHFVSWTRDKMKKDVNLYVTMLTDFNQKFAALQKFLLISKEDVNTECSKSE